MDHIYKVYTFLHYNMLLYLHFQVCTAETLCIRNFGYKSNAFIRITDIKKCKLVANQITNKLTSVQFEQAFNDTITTI